MRYGISSPEQFSLVEPALEQLEGDLSPLQNLSTTPNRVRGDLEAAFLDAENPVTWAIPTGEPVIRFVAADSMQDDLQETLLLGLVFCIMALWWGFREESPLSERLAELSQNKVPTASKIAVNSVLMASITYVLAGPNYAAVFGLIAVGCSLVWGTRPLLLATITSAPIFLMIVWLYAIVGLTGYGLNMVTVSIAAISLGVGIDYVIHVIERFREEMEKGVGTMKSIEAVGGASGIALFGSAVSDTTGFVIINQSEMGFFSTFGLFCAVMIGLSLIASLILAPAALRLAYPESPASS
jgi:predicted RND superfamily exporter protein